VPEICEKCGRTRSELRLPEFAISSTPSAVAGVSIPVGRAEANLHRLVASLCGFRELDLLQAAQANLKALLQVARHRTSKRQM
jgi:hypothetical protein